MELILFSLFIGGMVVGLYFLYEKRKAKKAAYVPDPGGRNTYDPENDPLAQLAKTTLRFEELKSNWQEDHPGEEMSQEVLDTLLFQAINLYKNLK